MAYIAEPAAQRSSDSFLIMCDDNFGRSFDGSWVPRNMKAVVVCPPSFQVIPHRFDTMADALNSGWSRTPGLGLAGVDLLGLTLLHEMVHMTAGCINTEDIACKETIWSFAFDTQC